MCSLITLLTTIVVSHHDTYVSVSHACLFVTVCVDSTSGNSCVGCSLSGPPKSPLIAASSTRILLQMSDRKSC